MPAGMKSIRQGFLLGAFGTDHYVRSAGMFQSEASHQCDFIAWVFGAMATAFTVHERRRTPLGALQRPVNLSRFVQDAEVHSMLRSECEQLPENSKPRSIVSSLLPAGFRMHSNRRSMRVPNLTIGDTR